MRKAYIVLYCTVILFIGPQGAAALTCPEISQSNDVFWAGYYQVSGQSAPGQSPFLAKIASKIMAQNRLLEILQGLEIEQTTVVTDGKVESSRIEAKLKGMIRNAVLHAEEYDTHTGTASTCLRLYVTDESDGIEQLVFDSVKRSMKKEAQ